MAETPSSLSKLEDALTGIEDFMRGMGPSSAQLSGTAEAQAVASTVLAAESSQPNAAKGMPSSVSSTSISGMSVDEEVESLFKGLGIKHSESIDPSLSLSKHQLNVDDDPSEMADATPIPTVQEPPASDKPATEAPEMRRPAAGNSLAVVEEVTKKRQSLLIDDELTVDEQSHLSRADASAAVPANDLRPEDLAAMRHGTIHHAWRKRETEGDAPLEAPPERAPPTKINIDPEVAERLRKRLQGEREQRELAAQGLAPMPVVRSVHDDDDDLVLEDDEERSMPVEPVPLFGLVASPAPMPQRPTVAELAQSASPQTAHGHFALGELGPPAPSQPRGVAAPPTTAIAPPGTESTWAASVRDGRDRGAAAGGSSLSHKPSLRKTGFYRQVNKDRAAVVTSELLSQADDDEAAGAMGSPSMSRRDTMGSPAPTRREVDEPITPSEFVRSASNAGIIGRQASGSIDRPQGRSSSIAIPKGTNLADSPALRASVEAQLKQIEVELMEWRLAFRQSHGHFPTVKDAHDERKIGVKKKLAVYRELRRRLLNAKKVAPAK